MRMTRESLLIATLVELADNLVDEFDVIEVLTMLCNRCVETIDIDAAGVMLASPAESCSTWRHPARQCENSSSTRFKPTRAPALIASIR